MRTAAEYRAGAEQCYRLAAINLDKALQDPNWTAALEQEGDWASLPPAVILDLDETVLDNSAMNARLVRSDAGGHRALWDAWVERASAPPVAGALEFIRYARSRGVQVLFVTNRRHDGEAGTRENLQTLGVSLEADRDTVLTKHEMPDWGWDKASRRRHLAQQYRILLLVGDDLNDFVAGANVSPEQRRDLAARYGAYWGTKWILLPNPLYGSWERSLYDFNHTLSNSEKLDRKCEFLETSD